MNCSDFGKPDFGLKNSRAQSSEICLPLPPAGHQFSVFVHLNPTSTSRWPDFISWILGTPSFAPRSDSGDLDLKHVARFSETRLELDYPTAWTPLGRGTYPARRLRS